MTHDMTAAANTLGAALDNIPLPPPPPAASSVPPLPEMLLGIPLTMQVVIGSARMTLSSLAALGPGSIVALDQKLGDPVIVLVNGREVARGEIFVAEGSEGLLGIRITAVTSAPAA